jgi:hypothetical protein
MKRYLLPLLVAFMLLGSASQSVAALWEYTFAGTVNDWQYTTSLGFHPVPANGDLLGRIVFDDTASQYVSFNYTVTGAGEAFNRSVTNFSQYFMSMQQEPFFAYGVFTAGTDNWALVYNDSQKTFTNNFGTFNFNADLTSLNVAPVPVPAAIWVLGTGLAGLLGFRRKFAA